MSATEAAGDQELLQRYTGNRDDDAFAELVRRHVNLVFSAAHRQVRSPQLAEEVAQSTFTNLARDAHRLAPDTILTAWLYQVTRRTAIDVVRREARRQLREQIATEMNALNATIADWTPIEPLLDDAMAALDETDRAAILLRYFENKSLREVGQVLGASDDAAQKRVSRAVERLREFFAKRGVTVGAGGLAVVISANAVQAAPVGLAVTISTAAALAGTGIATTATAATIKTIAMTTLQKTLVTAAVAVLAGAGLYEARQAAQLRVQNQTLHQLQAPLAEQIRQLRGERDAAAKRLAALANEMERVKGNSSELLKLRGEVTRLRNEATAAAVAINSNHFQADVLQILSNTPPVRTYLATVMTELTWDQVIVTGGWKIPSGKRVLVLTTIQPENDRQQLTIKSRVLEYTEAAGEMLGLSRYSSDGQFSPKAQKWSADQLTVTLKTAAATEGFELVAAPSVTTMSGRQAEVQMVDMHQTPSGEKYTTGPVLDFIPQISADGQSVQMTIVAQLNYSLNIPQQ